MGGGDRELRGSRIGRLFFEYDLKRAKSAVRGQIVAQSLYWTGWVTALAVAFWIVFHFLLTRRTNHWWAQPNNSRPGILPHAALSGDATSSLD